jgi:hypothetical protein
MRPKFESDFVKIKDRARGWRKAPAEALASEV